MRSSTIEARFRRRLQNLQSVGMDSCRVQSFTCRGRRT